MLWGERVALDAVKDDLEWNDLVMRPMLGDWNKVHINIIMTVMLHINAWTVIYADARRKGHRVGTVKAVIGYGVGLAVLGIVIAYLIRGYLMVRGDNVQMLARKDSERLKLSDSAIYERTFPGTPVHPLDSKVSDRSTTGPYDQASDQVDARR